MKILANVIIALIFCSSYCNLRAQQLTNTDLKFIKDIKHAIEVLNKKTDGGFKDLIIYGAVAKDTDLILYNAMPIEMLLEDKASGDLLHADKYSILNFFNQKKNIYTYSYKNSHDVMLAEKAMEEMCSGLGNDWKLVGVKRDQTDYTTKNLYYKEKWLAYFEKQKHGNSMQMSFIAHYTGNGEDAVTTNTNNTTDSFADSLSKNLDKIDDEILTPDSVKISNLQIAFYVLIGKGENGFPSMVLKETNRNKKMINYQAVAEDEMKAQTYQGIDLLPNNDSYFVCGYSNPTDVEIARKAMEGLKYCNNAVWKLENVQTGNENLVGKKIFANGKYVAYTTYLKKSNEFYIAVKDQVPYAKPTPKTKIIVKKKK